MKLNIGCGKHLLEGYENIDISDFGGNIVADICDPWKYADNTVDEIFASHILEHLTQEDVIHVLSEAHRVLKPGGILHVVVPHKDSDKAFVLWHKTFFTEYTFEDLESTRKWEPELLTTNAKQHIHWRVKKI